MSAEPLAGRRIVVTGAGIGLGAAYAEAIAAAGASVLVNDLEPEPAEATAARITDAGGWAVSCAGDVADWDSAGAVVDQCVAEFGGIDGLVNNAGIVGRLRKIWEEQPDARRTIDVNVLGVMHMAAHTTRVMVESGTRGSIVNVSSGNQCGHLWVSTYGASKGAVASYTYAWARELEEHGIRVNAISPNAYTNQHDEIIEQLGYNPEVNHAVYPSKEDNAAVVVYLLSDASSKLNGQNLRVAHESLCVMSHPMIVNPMAKVTTWSHDSVAEAFTEQLDDQLQPLGVALGDVTPIKIVY
jgi:NAD(P)-dependent dehydrogenase (short-subunit alcohol dehydrogenase family)